MKTLTELNKATTEYIQKYWEVGGASEFDNSINEISRQKIYVFAKQNGGKCWLYQINPWDDSAFFKRYTLGQKVYNFAFSIATAKRNHLIINTIKERIKPGEYDSKKNMKEVDIIFNEVERAGGIILFWS